MSRVEDQKVEKSIIDRCLCFDEFDPFYHNEWNTRNISIKWEINPLCSMFAMQLFDEKGNPYIVLRQLPETLDDVFLVAHEMMHVIRYFDKQYVKFRKALTPIAQMYKEEEIIDMCAKLGSMLDDPLIDSFLQDKYDFDAAHFYTNVLIPDTVEGLDLYGDSSYEWHIFKKALFYSQFSLQWDSIKDVDALHEWDKLKKQYKNRCPKTAKIGEELYSISRENGYDTIEKQRQLLNNIFNNYQIKGTKLSDILGTI